MATDRCIEILLEARDFGILAAASQRTRLISFLTSWFDQYQTLDTIDTVRLCARLRAHAKQTGLSVGDLMTSLLTAARVIHTQSSPPTTDQGTDDTLIESPVTEPVIEIKQPITVLPPAHVQDASGQPPTTPPLINTDDRIVVPGGQQYCADDRRPTQPKSRSRAKSKTQ